MSAKSPGDRRRRLAKRERDRAKCEAQMSVLREAGACCGNCEHRDKAPFGMESKLVCGLESTGGWYTPTTHDRLCPRHTARTPGEPL